MRNMGAELYLDLHTWWMRFSPNFSCHFYLCDADTTKRSFIVIDLTTVFSNVITTRSLPKMAHCVTRRRSHRWSLWPMLRVNWEKNLLGSNDFTIYSFSVQPFGMLERCLRCALCSQLQGSSGEIFVITWRWIGWLWLERNVSNVRVKIARIRVQVRFI